MRLVGRRCIVGVDENGLGPRLGPLVVTGVRLSLRGPMPTMAELRAATSLDDSKRVFAPGTRSRGEALALGVLGIRAAASLAELLHGNAVALPWAPPAGCTLRATYSTKGLVLNPRQRGRAEDSPRGETDPGPVSDTDISDTFDSTPLSIWSRSTIPSTSVCPALPARPLPRWTDEVPDLAPRLQDLGVVIERVGWAIVCPGVFNVAVAAETSKLAVDLRLFEMVVEVLAGGTQGECQTVCGKVGGTDRYAKRFATWAHRVRRVEVESRERSVYEVEGIGPVSFVRDADACEPAVAIASVLGKYVRELWMDDLAAAVGWSGAAPSGYHDPASRRLEARLREMMATGSFAVPPECVCRSR